MDWPITIRSYGIMVTLGILAGILLAYQEQKRKNLPPGTVDAFAFYAILAGILGARLYHVFVYDPGLLRDDPGAVLKFWRGGLAVHGALVGGIVAAFVFCRFRRLSFWKLADCLAPSLMLGQAIGRVGCFLNGCCYGKPTGIFWAVTYSDPRSLAPQGIRLHPAPLYELVLGVAAFLFLWKLRRRLWQAGRLFLVYGLLHSLIRFFLAFLRGDTILLWEGGLKAGQVAAGVAILVILFVWVVLSCQGGWTMGGKGKKTLVLVLLILILAVAAWGTKIRREVERQRLSLAETAASLIEEKRYEEALEKLLLYEERFTPTEEVLLQQADCLSHLGRQEKADSIWQRLIEEFPGGTYTPQARYQLARGDELGGRGDEARVAYEKILADYPYAKVVADVLVRLGDMSREKEEWEEAREYYERVLREFSEAEAASLARGGLGEVNTELLFSPRPMEGTQFYFVESGDTLDTIAKKFNTTVELITRSNNLRRSLIRPGQRLKVIAGSFSLRIDVKSNTMELLLDGKFIKKYLVGTGKYESTPEGEFQIVNKQTKPTWYSREGIFQYGDPRNILGTRWMGIDLRRCPQSRSG